MKATIVFQKNWDAIHALNPDGSRKYRYIINRGSSRSSKTISLIQCYDLYARKNESKRLTAWRDTKTDCKKTVLNDMLKQLKRQGMYLRGYTFNKTESIFTYTNGSTVEIHGTDDEETVHGLTQDAAWLNEPYKISRDTFDQIDQRTEDFIFIDYNPKKGHWVEEVMKDPRAIVIDSTFWHNPFCPDEMRRKILSYQPVKFSRVVLDGVIDYGMALTYDTIKNELGISDKQINELRRCQENEDKGSANAYKWQVYGLGTKAEKPNRIFKWKSIPYQEYLSIDAPIYIGVDWGNVDPFGILEAKYLDGKLFLHELNYESENDIREKLSSTERIQVGNLNDDQNKEVGIVVHTFNKLSISKSVPIICDTNRPLKIAALRRAGFKSMAANKLKGSIVDGIDLLNDLDVYYTSQSKNIEYEQEHYSRRVDRSGVVLDEPEDMDNHLMDPARYVALYLQIKGIIKLV